MKKILSFIAIALLTLNLTAQELKTVCKEKKESCCSKKEGKTKGMTAAEIEKCQIKCKAEGKKCDAAKAKKS